MQQEINNKSAKSKSTEDTNNVEKSMGGFAWEEAIKTVLMHKMKNLGKCEISQNNRIIRKDRKVTDLDMVVSFDQPRTIMEVAYEIDKYSSRLEPFLSLAQRLKGRKYDHFFFEIKTQFGSDYFQNYDKFKKLGIPKNPEEWFLYKLLYAAIIYYKKKLTGNSLLCLIYNGTNPAKFENLFQRLADLINCKDTCEDMKDI
jgi:hypothetical protein